MVLAGLGLVGWYCRLVDAFKVATFWCWHVEPIEAAASSKDGHYFGCSLALECYRGLNISFVIF